MKSKKIVTCIGYAALAAAVIFSCFAPNRVSGSSANSISTPGYRSVQLSGVVRDFSRAHPDFEVVPSQGKGQYTGLVEVHLGLGDRPTPVENAFLVKSPARDFAGRVIAPHIADGRLADPLDGVNVLLVVGNGEKPAPADLARAEALRYWGHTVSLADATVTDEALETILEQTDVIHISDRADWRAWSDRLADTPLGIVVENPRIAAGELHLAFATSCAEGTAVHLTDTSHEITRGFNAGPLEIFSAPVLLHHAYGGVAEDARALARIGENIKPALLAVDTGGALRERETAPARRVRLPWGVMQPDADQRRTGNRDANCSEFMADVSAGADGIDFTLLNRNGLTLLKRSIAWASMGNPRGLLGGGRREGDTRAEIAETPSRGGISSPATFGQWFSDAPQVNLSQPMALTLYEQPDGTWVFDDRANSPYHALGGFYPVDGQLLGSEGGAANNHHFTAQVAGAARYEAGKDLYLKVGSTAEVWVFVDGRLAIDLGGVHGLLEQRIDLDRLSLAEGDLFSLDVFIAHRTEAPSRLRLETNAMVVGGTAVAAGLVRPDSPSRDPRPFELAAEADVSLSVASAEGR